MNKLQLQAILDVIDEFHGLPEDDDELETLKNALLLAFNEAA